MLKSFSDRYRETLSWLIALALTVLPLSLAMSETVTLTDGLMDEALGAIGLVLDKELDADDRAWLREHWNSEAARQPERTVSGLEGLAVSAKDIRAGTDPLTSVQLRTQIVDETFCATKRTSDPKAARLQSIFAPDELVLVADCVAGAVVTPFDVKALVVSNALVGEIVGSPVDVGVMEAEILDALPEAFSTIPLEQQQRLLWGELRATALDMLWSSVDEATREQLALAAKETFDEYGDVATTAMIFEKTALKKIGELRVFARQGDQIFKQAEMATFLEFMAFVTDASLSPRERADVTDLFVAKFQKDPEGIVRIATNLRAWLDKGYYFGKESANGQTRSWTAAEQARMRAEEAALLYCENDKPDEPERQRLIALVFADDPVIEADCADLRLVRESDRLLAEAGDRRLTRGALDAHRGAFELIFAFQFSPEERRWFDEAAIADLQNGSTGLTKAVDQFQQLVTEIKAPARVGPHLNERRREDLALQIYCINRDGDHPDVVRMIEIIDVHDPILFDDCGRQMVVRQSDLDGLISSVNFIASLGDFTPLSADEILALPARLRRDFEAANDGPTWYRSTFAMLSYWWSRMPVEERHQVASTIKQEVSDRDEIFAYSWTLGKRAGFQAAKLALCDFQTLKLAYDTKRIGIASRAIINTNPMADSPWVNPEAIDDDASFYGVMAPFVQQQCGTIWN